MDLQQILLFLVKLIAGTGVFLVGVHLVTENIEQLATQRIRELFGKTAGRKLVNVGIGTLTTALIQSSGVTTVLIVGFVNVGIISLSQATAMIMGANIGTTITAQIAALSAFPFTTYVQVLAGAGILTAMVTKKERGKQIGFIVSGLGLIFVGLSVMSDAMKANRDAVQLLFENVTDPFLLFFIGIVLTALVQSSSATTSVIIAMSVAGLTIGTGGNEMMYIILGTNIGSCVTALMSAVGSKANAKRASLIHFLFNTFGSVIFLLILMSVPNLMRDSFGKWFASPATQIAMFHTFFNVVCTVLFLPFSEVFVKISRFLIRDKKQPREVSYLDERMLSTPAIAVAQARNETMLLGQMAMDAFVASYAAFAARDKSRAADITEIMDRAQDKSRRILEYLIKASANADAASEKAIASLHENISDIMRIADIADNFIKYTARTVDGQLVYSQSALDGIETMVERVQQLFALTSRRVLENDAGLLSKIDEIEEEIDGLRKKLLDEHIDRLNRGQCKADNSGVFVNLVSNLERLGDHITYVAHSE